MADTRSAARANAAPRTAPRFPPPLPLPATRHPPHDSTVTRPTAAAPANLRGAGSRLAAARRRPPR
eukprot:10644588-Lingulodinium_polyedra.AAC.1